MSEIINAKSEKIRSSSRSKIVALGAAATFGLSSLMPTNAEAASVEGATGGCYGQECVGKNPEGLCDGDAITVASMAIKTLGGSYAGQLDLRYSDSCKANWGRFTRWEGRLLSPASTVPLWGRVTSWNPGEESQNAIKGAGVVGSNWTNMVDGTKEACTGVEIIKPDSSIADSPGSENHSDGWFWGPCY